MPGDAICPKYESYSISLYISDLEETFEKWQNEENIIINSEKCKRDEGNQEKARTQDKISS